MVHGALDHGHHVIDLRRVGARDERGAGGDEFFIGLIGRSMAPTGSVLI